MGFVRALRHAGFYEWFYTDLRRVFGVCRALDLHRKPHHCPPIRECSAPHTHPRFGSRFLDGTNGQFGVL